MVTFCFLFLILLNVWLIFVYLSTVYVHEGLGSPLSFVLLFYAFNYPLRAIVLFVATDTDLAWEVNSWEWHFSCGEICTALLYATLFASCCLLIYLQASRRVASNPSPAKRLQRPTGLNTSWQTMVFYSLVCIYIFAFLRETATGGLFLLYEEYDDLKREFLVNAVRMAVDLKWFLVAYSFLRLQRERTVSNFLMAACVGATVLISAFVSTSKGEIVVLVLLWSACSWIVHRKLPTFAIAASTFVVIAFAFYSYTARAHDYSGMRSGTDVDTIGSAQRTAETVFSVYSHSQGVWKEQVGKVFSRFDGMDSLILCQRRNRFLGDGIYLAGSLVELGNVVPRALWPNRPHLSFNHHTTQAVWGRPYYYFLEMPIGRIGESFYVLNWCGLLYAVPYALFWSWLYRTHFLRARSDLHTAFYLNLVFLLVLPDACLVYNWKRAAFVMAAYALLRADQFAVFRVKRSSGIRQPLRAMHVRAGAGGDRG